MVAPVRADAVRPSRASTGELIPLPARRYVLRVQVDGAEYIYDGTAKLPTWQADVIAALRGYNRPAATGATMIALEAATRTSVRLMLPMLTGLVSTLRKHSPALAALVPELGKLPKHTDALEHLASWLVEAAFTTLGTGTYVLEPDEDTAYLDRRRDLIVQPIQRVRWMVPGTVDARTTRQDDRDAASGEHDGD